MGLFPAFLPDEVPTDPRDRAVKGLTAIERVLAASAPPALFLYDPNKAAIRCMALGALQAARLAIDGGEDPLEMLYRLEETAEACFYGQWPALDDLITRLIIELDV